jgi:hypothetical protein
LKDAYSGVPVRVIEGTLGDVQANVLNAQNLNGTGICGASAIAANNVSWQHQASYVNIMLNAQNAYNVVNITSSQAEQTLWRPPWAILSSARSEEHWA